MSRTGKSREKGQANERLPMARRVTATGDRFLLGAMKISGVDGGD